MGAPFLSGLLKLVQFFSCGPISFTNGGPVVPGHICSGPAHWLGPIVLPPNPAWAHCPHPQRVLLTADLYGQASCGLQAALPQLAEVLKALDLMTFAPVLLSF